jgi:nucleolar protein 53
MLLVAIAKESMQPPDTFHPHRFIELPAVTHPHQGTSYNPLETAHKELLLTAHETELRREAEAAKFEGVKERIHASRRTVNEDTGDGAPGMLLDTVSSAVEVENNAEDPQASVVLASKVSTRKTQKQRRKAAQILAEVCPGFTAVRRR